MNTKIEKYLEKWNNPKSEEMFASLSELIITTINSNLNKMAYKFGNGYSPEVFPVSYQIWQERNGNFIEFYDSLKIKSFWILEGNIVKEFLLMNKFSKKDVCDFF